MFSVGMHFHPQELLRVWRVAVPGAVAQSAVAGVRAGCVARAFGWSDAAGAVFGMSLAVASTVVLMRMLVDHGKLASHGGHVAVGWLIVEDVFTVVALVVLPALAAAQAGNGGAGLGMELLGALGKAVAFARAAVGARQPARQARHGAHRAHALRGALHAHGVRRRPGHRHDRGGVFHVSVALGAFFAGLVVGQSRIGPQAAAYMTPFRDVFSALFFVSVGMLFDPVVPARAAAARARGRARHRARRQAARRAG